MLKYIKSILPRGLKDVFIKVLITSRGVFIAFIAKSKLLTNLYYFLLNGSFKSEMFAVISGKCAFDKKLREQNRSSYFLRRNIHRLEKGLLMNPRKKNFAQNYIRETVNVFNMLNAGEINDRYELKWANDVLVEYFRVVEDTDRILSARESFRPLAGNVESAHACIPYPSSQRPKSLITYQEFRSLSMRRRSVRFFEEKLPDKKKIERAVSIASMAPSACNRQPYRFILSQEKETVFQISEMAPGTSGWSENIPTIIVVIGDLSSYPNEKDRHLIYTDSGLASMQLMLALETQGISTCPINWPDLNLSHKKISDYLQLEKYERVVMLLAVGYAREDCGIAFSQKKHKEILIQEI